MQLGYYKTKITILNISPIDT